MCKTKVFFHHIAYCCPIFLTFFTEETFLSPLYILDPFVINNWPCMYGFILGLHSYLPFIYVTIFIPIPYHFDYVSFYSNSNLVWNKRVWCLPFCFLFSRLLWLFGVFCDSVQILGLFVLLTWKYYWNFNMDCIESVYCFG